MAQQGDFKTGRARRIGGERARRTGARQPARKGDAGGLPCLRAFETNAQQEQGDARFFRRPRQPQSGGEIEHRRRPKNFDQGRAEALAARRLDPGAQHGLRVAPPHQRQQRGIGAEFREADPVCRPASSSRKSGRAHSRGRPGAARRARARPKPAAAGQSVQGAWISCKAARFNPPPRASSTSLAPRVKAASRSGAARPCRAAILARTRRRSAKVLTRGGPSPLCTTSMGAPQNVPDMFILKTETPRESRGPKASVENAKKTRPARAGRV